MAPFMNDEDEESINDIEIIVDSDVDTDSTTVNIDPTDVFDAMYLRFVHRIIMDRKRRELDALAVHQTFVAPPINNIGGLDSWFQAYVDDVVITGHAHLVRDTSPRTVWNGTTRSSDETIVDDASLANEDDQNEIDQDEDAINPYNLPDVVAMGDFEGGTTNYSYVFSDELVRELVSIRIHTDSVIARVQNNRIAFPERVNDNLLADRISRSMEASTNEFEFDGIEDDVSF